jgi:phage gpG-like protein
MSAFKIDIVNGQVQSGLRRLAERCEHPEPAMRAIGEAFTAMTRRSFETSTDPWGRRWQPNSQATIGAMLTRPGGNWRKKDGKLSAKGAGRVMSKKPLIGETGVLSGSSIFYEAGDTALDFGSSAIQAAIQQLGGAKAEFPHLWGDIPARPFIPVDRYGSPAPAAEAAVVDVVQEFLLGAWR